MNIKSLLYFFNYVFVKATIMEFNCYEKYTNNYKYKIKSIYQ